MPAISNLASSNAAAAQLPPPKTAGGGFDPLTAKDTFLRLLVAQLRNQNPLQPSDPIEFVTQLTQFSTLEQTLAMTQNLEAIKTAVEKLAEKATPPPPPALGGGSSQP